jgi:hypothetical protein
MRMSCGPDPPGSVRTLGGTGMSGTGAVPVLAFVLVAVLSGNVRADAGSASTG